MAKKSLTVMLNTTMVRVQLHFSQLLFYFCHRHCVTCCGLSACQINEDIYIYILIRQYKRTRNEPSSEWTEMLSPSLFASYTAADVSS